MKRMALGMACASALAWCGPARSDEPAQDPAKLFDSLDANHDGTLTGDEVDQDRKRFFERLVRVGDKNEDKKLSRDEFVGAMSEQEKPVETPQSRLGGDRERPLGTPGQMFERLDRNRDGKFTKQEIPDQAPAEMRERLEMVFTAAQKSELTKDDFEKLIAKYGPPGGRGPGGDKRPEGDRPRPEGERGREMAREGERGREAERRPEMERDGKRPEGGPEGDRMARGGDRPEGREGMRGFPRMEGGRGGSPLVRILDRNEDGKLSRSEAARIVDRFEELDRNGDGELELFELVAMPAMPGGPEGMRPGQGFGRPGFRGPEAMRPEAGERGREMAREGDRRPEGDRPRPEGARDGDRPRPEGMRDGDRPRPEGAREGDRPRPDGPRDGDRPRPDGPRDGDRPRPEGRPEAGPAPRERDGGRGTDFFARLDKDGDGFISKSEAPERMKERFKDMDANDDGKITPEELRSALARELGVPGERRPPQE